MLTLTAGASSLVVAPEYGAALTGWLLGRTPILRRALPQAVLGGNPHTMACFPLLPYGNRICHGRFRWSGVDYALQPNFGDNPHTIHGIGWQRPWTVEDAHPKSVTLSLAHRPDASWPFAFRAEIDYRLSDETLTVTIQMTNQHAAPAPAGIGIHPHFPKTNAVALRFNATGAWENGPDSLPVQHAPPRPEWQHGEPRAVARSRLDNCFTGWDGIADIHTGAARLRIEASKVFRQLQVFTPSWGDFFCVEPVSHVPDALNRLDLPEDQVMHVLQPGETLAGTIRFTPVSCPRGSSHHAADVGDQQVAESKELAG
jgi:aldose 1-epimerase